MRLMAPICSPILNRLSARLLFDNFAASGSIIVLDGKAVAHKNDDGSLAKSGMFEAVVALEKGIMEGLQTSSNRKGDDVPFHAV